MKTMTALMKVSPETTELKKVPVPRPGENEVLLRIKAAALCGTDLHIHRWNSWARGAGIRLPLVLGHECCAEVVELGPGASGVAVGDRVAVETHIPCGTCFQCLGGEQHICRNLVLFGVHRDGCFAEYACAPAAVARKLPAGLRDEIGAVMEPFGTGFRAAFETGVGGASVVVIGCGPIGLFAAASAAVLGAAKIFAVDVSSARLAIAGTLGAEFRLDPRKDDVRGGVLEATGGVGADVVIDASGNAAAISGSFSFLRKGGRVALVGLPDKPVELNLGSDVVFKEAKIFGIHGRRMYETWANLEALLASGRLNVDPVVTHSLPLAEWGRGIELAEAGEACKVVFKL